MGTRETRRQRGRRQGRELLDRLLRELRAGREVAGVSQRALAAELGCSQSEVNRLEQHRFSAVPLVRLSEVASVLGLELAAGLHPRGDGLRDQGHQAVIARLLKDVGSRFAHSREVPFPNVGDRRSWDLMLRIDDPLVGVECETRVRDAQALVRRIRERERDGGADEILVVLADTRHNRKIVDQLREALGPRYATSPRRLIAVTASRYAAARLRRDPGLTA